jgi:stage V sporulation protein G
MEITDIRIKLHEGTGTLKAVASITLDNLLAIHDIKVIETHNNRFVAMPSRQQKDGKFLDIVHPIATCFRNLLTDEILKRYELDLLQKTPQ